MHVSVSSSKVRLSIFCSVFALSGSIAIVMASASALHQQACGEQAVEQLLRIEVENYKTIMEENVQIVVSDKFSSVLHYV